MLSDKNILVGITAGISAYKTYELIRMYRRNNANVKVILTPNALNFVNILTLQTLSSNKVYVEQYETQFFSPEHISLAEWADIFVIAPVTANTIGKIANGICDNLLTSIFCAFKKTVLLTPAMNTGMWENCFVQENIKKLVNQKCEVLQPKVGYLACGTQGAGRMCEPEEIFEKTCDLLLYKKRFLAGKKVVITAGGTREKLDGVRYLSNYSSGKMGIALAKSANALGANVVLITTVDCTLTDEIDVIKVDSAIEMQAAVEKEFSNANCLIMAAAVADYRAKNVSNQKLKKEDLGDTINIELVKNPDILQEICKTKRADQTVIGFCAETSNLLENAKKKIQTKNCDYIVANDVSRGDIAFGSEENEVYILDRNLKETHIDKMSKDGIAKKILEFVFDEQK